MKTSHIVIGLVAAAGVGYWFYKKKQGINVMQSIMPSSNKPTTIVSDSTTQTANAPAYTIANDQVQVVKTTGPIPVLVEYTQKPAEPAPVAPSLPPPTQDYKPAPYLAPQPQYVAPQVLPPPPVIAACKYPTGQLLRASGPKVYQVDSACVRHWVTGAAFGRLKLSQSNVKNISNVELSTTSEGDTINGLSGYNNMMF